MTEEERAHLTVLTLARLDQVVDRLEFIANLISRKEFEKAINQMVDEERERQERLKDKRKLGGFNVR